MDDAGVNVAARFGNLLFDALVLQFRQQFLDFFRAAVNFAFQHPALHGLGDGGSNGCDVEWLVDVVTRAQSQRLPDGVRRLECRHHDRLDFRVHKFEAFQNFDARHARHADVQHRHVNRMFLRQLNRRRPVLGHQQIVFILENNAQRLARAVLVVHNQQQTASLGCCLNNFGGVIVHLSQ